MKVGDVFATSANERKEDTKHAVFVSESRKDLKGLLRTGAAPGTYDVYQLVEAGVEVREPKATSTMVVSSGETAKRKKRTATE